LAYDVAEVEASRADRRWARPITRRVPRRGGGGPWLALLAGCALIALGAAVIAARVSGWSLDESLIQQSALHYTSGLPGSFFHDVDARGTSRLYPLVLSIAFHFMNGVQAVRADRVLSTLLFVSAAIPIYLLARVLLRSQWWAVAAALLSVAVPWLTITSALFEENLAYPLFWWAVLACCHAVWRPSVRRDALALLTIVLLIGTRTELVSMFVGYVAVVVGVSLWRAGVATNGIRGRISAATRYVLRRHPVTVVAFLAACGFVLYERFAPNWHHNVELLLGTYSNVVIRDTFPSSAVQTMLLELIALAFGVGLLPAILSIPWFVRRVSRPQLDRRGVYLIASGALLLIFIVMTVFATGGYAGAQTEERYFMYVAPALWLGAIAALEDRTVRTSDIVLTTIALAALYGAIPFLDSLSSDTAFTAPVESIVPHVVTHRLGVLGINGVTTQDVLVLVALAGGLLTALVWRRWPQVRALWTVGAATALQLVITAYAFAVIDGKVQGIPGRTGGSLSAQGWVDANAHGAEVAWLENQPVEPLVAGGDTTTITRMRNVLFWNARVRSWIQIPATGVPAVVWPMTGLPGVELRVNTTDGVLTPPSELAGVSRVVSASESPFLQLEGTRTGTSPEGQSALIRLARPVRASWLATGLSSERGLITGATADVYAFAPRASSPRAEAITLSFTPAAAPAAAPATPSSVGPSAAAAGPRAPHVALIARLGKVDRRLSLAAGGPARQLRLLACFAPGRSVVSGSLLVPAAAGSAAGTVGGTLNAVTISAASAAERARCGAGV
jgi:hypothetical protein